MALRKIMAQRILRASRFINPSVSNCRVSSPSVTALSHPTSPNNLAPDPGEQGIFRRYLHNQSVPKSSELRFLPTGEKLLEKLWEMDNAKQRIRLDSLRPPPAAEAQEKGSPSEGTITVKDAVKILRFSQLESLKSKLRHIEKDCIPYPEFVEICAKSCSSIDQGIEFAKMLDQSGSVIVLGKIVFLRPQQDMETMFPSQIS